MDGQNPDRPPEPLPPRAAQVLRLKHQGFTQNEIAESLGISQPAVSDALRRARVQTGAYERAIAEQDLQFDLDRLDNCLRRMLAIVNDPAKRDEIAISATHALISVQERRAKLLGMDYAAKTASDRLPTDRAQLVKEIREVAARLLANRQGAIAANGNGR